METSVTHEPPQWLHKKKQLSLPLIGTGLHRTFLLVCLEQPCKSLSQINYSWHSQEIILQSFFTKGRKQGTLSLYTFYCGRYCLIVLLYVTLFYQLQSEFIPILSLKVWNPLVTGILMCQHCHIYFSSYICNVFVFKDLCQTLLKWGILPF